MTMIKNIKKLAAVLMTFVMVFSISGCGKKDEEDTSVNKPAAENAAQEEFNRLMQDIFTADITNDMFTLSTYVKNTGSYNIELPDDIGYDSFEIEYSEDEKAELEEECRGFIKRLEEIEYESLSDYQKFVYDKMEAELDIAIESYGLNDLYSPLAVNNGWISTVEINMYEYLFESEADLVDYQMLLESLPGIMDDIPAYVQKQIDEYGYAPSDYMIEENIKVLEELQNTEDNPFIDAYNAKVDDMEEKPGNAEEYKESNEKYVTETLIPAFGKLASSISSFKGSSDETLGIFYADGGEDYFNNKIKAYGFDADADELFEYLYDKFMVVYNAEMELAQEDYSAVMKYYNEDYEPDVPKEPEKIMKRLIKEFTGEFPELGNESYELSYLPKSMEIEGMLAYCVMNRLDDANGTAHIRVNGDAVGEDMVTLYTTLAHEGYPGHMLHFNYFLNSIQYPEEGMLGYLGYMEGWARYVDNKAYYKMGVDENVARILQLDNDLNYTLSGLLDIAINGLGYKKDDVSGLMEDLLGYSDDETVNTLYDSFTADPGLYIPYSAGYWYTVDLINDYKKAYGDTLSRSELYKNYMSAGPTTFSVLRKYLLG